jgi:hypothetical protein
VVSKWPDNDLIEYLAPSGFIFLRFFCPALISPKNYDLLDEHPGEELTRDLTLITKTLQNIANFIEFNANKEPYMAPVNDFVTSLSEEMKQFLDNICTPLNNAIDIPQSKYVLNFGREMSRVHFHINSLLPDMKQKFGANDKEIIDLELQVKKINEETGRDQYEPITPSYSGGNTPLSPNNNNNNNVNISILPNNVQLKLPSHLHHNNNNSNL